MSIRLTESQVLDRFSDIVATSLRIHRDKVFPEAHLLDDLGAESLDLIEIGMESESAFHVWLPEKNILETATEVFGPAVLERDGYLTDAGKRLLRRRLPEEDAYRFEGEVSVQDLRSYFLTVRGWARMIHTLVEHTPTSCKACEGPLGEGINSSLKCRRCGLEITLRQGEDLNREWVQTFYRAEYAPIRAEAHGAD